MLMAAACRWLRPQGICCRDDAFLDLRQNLTSRPHSRQGSLAALTFWTARRLTLTPGVSSSYDDQYLEECHPYHKRHGMPISVEKTSNQGCAGAVLRFQPRAAG